MVGKIEKDSWEICETMLCPQCQNTELITASVTTTRPVRYFGAAFKLRCPICGCLSMYNADPPLVDTLAMLNKNYVKTYSHCARFHPNYNTTPDIPNWNIKTGHYDGPYIMFRDVPFKAMSILYVIVKGYLDKINRAKYTVLLDMNITIPGENSTFSRLEVALNQNDPETIHEALTILDSICRDWIHDTTVIGIEFVPAANQHRVHWERLTHYTSGADDQSEINPFMDEDDV